MGFLLQIIYLNGSVLKLFTLWVCFCTTKRLSERRVRRKGDTWQHLGRALRTGATGSAAAAGASGRVGYPGATGRAGDPGATQLGRTLFNIFYILYIVFI